MWKTIFWIPKRANKTGKPRDTYCIVHLTPSSTAAVRQLIITEAQRLSDCRKRDFAILPGFQCDSEQDSEDGVGYHIEAAYGHIKAGDSLLGEAGEAYMQERDGADSLIFKNSPIPHDVKDAIKSMYAAGVTKPQKIMKSLVEDGVMEEGGFPIDKLYNYLKKMKIKMGVRKRSGERYAS